MKPLSPRQRRSYLVFFTLIFLLIIPVLIFYARGYRLTDNLTITRTGGVYVSTPDSNFNVLLDGVFVRTTGIFQRNALIQNLKPGTYTITISREGYQTWEKQLKVFPETVTEAHSFSLRNELEKIDIPQFLTSATTSTSTVPTKIPNPEYARVLALFATSTASTTASSVKPGAIVGAATSTDIEKILKKIVVTKVQGKLRVTWAGTQESAPSYFCQNSVCQKEIVIARKSSIGDFDFFPDRDDVLVVALSDGLYAVEIDNRPPQNEQKISDANNPSFRISGSTVYIKEGKILSSVSF